MNEDEVENEEDGDDDGDAVGDYDYEDDEDEYMYSNSSDDDDCGGGAAAASVRAARPQPSSLSTMSTPPPKQLNHGGKLTEAKISAKTAGKLLLVNIQSGDCAACHAVNRDVWGDDHDLVQDVVAAHCILWQMNSSIEGQTYVTQHKVTRYPHLAIMDPHTGNLLWHEENWTQSKPPSAERFVEIATNNTDDDNAREQPAVKPAASFAPALPRPSNAGASSTTVTPALAVAPALFRHTDAPPRSTNAAAVEPANVSSNDARRAVAAPPSICRNTPVGLDNMGNTCYMNVLLQKIFCTIPIRDAILAYPLKSELVMAQEMKQMMSPTKIGENRNVDPSKLARGLIQLKYLLQQMETQQSSAVNPKQFIDALGFDYNINECPLEVWTSLFKFFFEYLGVDRIFKGTLESYTREILPAGSFESPRENCIRREFTEIGVKVGGRESTLSAALKLEFTQSETLRASDGNGWKPDDGSNEKVDASRGMCLLSDSLPRVLTVALKRYQYNGDAEKICDHFEFPVALDMSSFCKDAHASSNKMKYRLRYIAMHIGESSHRGHYYGYLCNFAENKWYKLNDTVVTEVDECQVLEDAFGGTSCAYMLQYTCCDPSVMNEHLRADRNVDLSPKGNPTFTSLAIQQQMDHQLESLGTGGLERVCRDYVVFDTLLRKQRQQGTAALDGTEQTQMANTYLTWSIGKKLVELRSKRENARELEAKKSVEGSASTVPVRKLPSPLDAGPIIHDSHMLQPPSKRSRVGELEHTTADDDVIMVEDASEDSSVRSAGDSLVDSPAMMCYECSVDQDPPEIPQSVTYLEDSEASSAPSLGMNNTSSTPSLDDDSSIYDQGSDSCDNCFRKQFTSIPQYHLTFKTVPATRIRNIRSKLRVVKSRKKGRADAELVTLCQDCSRCLLSTDETDGMNEDQKKKLCSWENMWAAFYWNLLTGQQAIDGVHFYHIYDPRYLWQLIPKSLRRYWVHAIEKINFHGMNIYDGCSVNEPPSLFDDRTVEVDGFWEDIDSYELPRLLRALNAPKPIMIPNVLCPWGCTEFCFRAKYCNPALVLQNQLRKAVLNLPTDMKASDVDLVESSRLDYIRANRDYEFVLLNKTEDWMIQPTVFLVPGKGLMCGTCRNHSGADVTKRLYTHPPRKPHHNLSSEQSDQLSHAQIQSRICRPMRKKKYSTTFHMTTLQSSYSGIDSMSVSTQANFSKTSEMLARHEELSIAKRDDIHSLLLQNVKEGNMTAELASNLQEQARRKYPKGSMDSHVQGATYVELNDTMLLQKDLSEDSLISIHIRKKTGDNEFRLETIQCRRSWAPTINFIQMEDSSGYGYPFKPILPYGGYVKKRPVMMMWALSGILAGSKDLWRLVDQKPHPFSYDEWEGHIMAHVYSLYMRHDDIRKPWNSPFRTAKASNTASNALDVLDEYLSVDMCRYDGSSSEDPNLFFQFDVNLWKNLFPEEFYPSLAIFTSIGDILSAGNTLDDAKILMVVDQEPPPADFDGLGSPTSSQPDHICIGDDAVYEARVILCIKPKEGAVWAGDFEATRFVRHGTDTFSSWWKQVRTTQVMTQCHSRSAFSEIPADCLSYITVYVKLEKQHTDKHKLDFHRSLGGQCHLYCACEESFPMIVTGVRKESKSLCSKPGCRRKELYVCSSIECNTRICRRCFDELPQNDVSTWPPPSSDVDTASANISNDEVLSEEEEESEDEEDNDENEIGEFSSHCSNDEAEEEDDPYQSQDDLSLEYFSQESASDDFSIVDDGGGDLLGPNEEYMENGISQRFPDDVSVDSSATDISHEDQYGGLDNFLIRSDYDPMNDMGGPTSASALPSTSAGDLPQSALNRSDSISVPCHVLLNQAGVCCTRFNSRIKGTQAQQNFLQKMVSKIHGTSFPLAYLLATLFPRHFYAQATGDPCAILGARPVSGYTNKPHPHGLASLLEEARTLLTHSSSSTSTCPHFMAMQYDIQANLALNRSDSRVINRHGFMVDTKSRKAFTSRDNALSELSESIDSNQMANNLSATQKWHESDLFLTYTCNQKEHPGIKHLHEHKEGKTWTDMYPGYRHLSEREQVEVDRSFELAYGAIVGRAWLEASSFWIDFITKTVSTIIPEVEQSFFRREYQKDSGNLSHLHGILALKKKHMDDAAVQKLIYDLQACSVCEVFPTNKISEFMDKGLFDNPQDWFRMTKHAEEVLSHKCSERCLMRIKYVEGPEAYRCRKLHPVRDGIIPLEHDFVPIRYKYSQASLDILKDCGLYDSPTSASPHGEFHHPILMPYRHVGLCNPNETQTNMSPVIPEHFAATMSMQNCQILTHTNGVARYVVKYVVKLDEGNRVVVHSDPHTGECVQAEHQFLHNTKIARSKYNEDKAFQKSRQRDLPQGRQVAFVEMQQHMLGYPDVQTTYEFCDISTRPFEERSTTKIVLDSNGDLLRPDQDDVDDAQSTQPVSQLAREMLAFPASRQLRPNQRLLYRHSGVKSTSYDKVSQFGLRPLELIQVFCSIGNYFRWFHISDDSLGLDKVSTLLSIEIDSCCWIDGLGRRVFLRRKAFDEVKAHLENLDDSNLSTHSRELKFFVLSLIEDGSENSDFVQEDGGKALPIPVYSCVSPNHAIPFLLHTMLMIGEYETELDFRMQGTIRQSLALANLIGDKTDEISLRAYTRALFRRVVDEVLPVQPVSLRRLDQYIVAAYNLIESIIMRDEIPCNDLPACILTEVLDDKSEELDSFWREKKEDILHAIYGTLPEDMPIPSRDDVVNATKAEYVNWDPNESFIMSSDQSDESFSEQCLAVEIGKRLVDKYMIQFGAGASILSKSMILHGAPGSGKSHVNSFMCLYAISQGLRVMTSALMANRANMLGGIHFHKLFGVPVKKSGTPYRLAELALKSLERKSNICYRRALLTVDVLALDECGQLSAEQVTVLDIILRKLRNTHAPFGGVLIFGTMDHTQLGAIDGLPFLLSSHILTGFVMVRLSHSVRAHNDPDFQRLQAIARMPPSVLLANPELEVEFKSLLETVLTWVKDWNASEIDPTVYRMYSRVMPAQEATEEYVNGCRRQLVASNTPYLISTARDVQRGVGSRAEYTTASADVSAHLNAKLREPNNLLFYRGAQFEATVNVEGRYNQSQLVVMLELPSLEAVRSRSRINMLAAKPGLNYLDTTGELPTRESLIEQGWKPVQVGCAPESIIVFGGRQASRQQYSLKHIFSGTINKQMGNTITGRCAVEVTPQFSPWQKEQAVVMLSRTTRGIDQIIVGDKPWAIAKLWQLITTGTEWAPYIQQLLDNISINSLEDERRQHILDLPAVIPIRTCDISLPTDATGYVYFLVSVRDITRSYIGQTEDLRRRLSEHNSGYGARGTANPLFRPYAVGGFICGLAHMDTSQRERIEYQWKEFAARDMRSGHSDMFSRLSIGERIVENYNSSRTNQDERITFVITIKRSALNE